MGDRLCVPEYHGGEERKKAGQDRRRRRRVLRRAASSRVLYNNVFCEGDEGQGARQAGRTIKTIKRSTWPSVVQNVSASHQRVPGSSYGLGLARDPSCVAERGAQSIGRVSGRETHWGAAGGRVAREIGRAGSPRRIGHHWNLQ